MCRQLGVRRGSAWELSLQLDRFVSSIDTCEATRNCEEALEWAFCIRKSVSVGPLRFNLSKSGIGVSAGVRGFRLGTGPRGNYVHVGRYGLYYRRTLSPRAAPTTGPTDTHQQVSGSTHGPLEEIDSGDVANMVDSSSEELLAEFDKKQRSVRLAPPAALMGVGATVGAVAAGWPPVAVVMVVIAASALTLLARYRDQLSRTTVVLYDLDEGLAAAYQVLHDTASDLAACNGRWHIEAQGRVRDRKYHAGASHLVRRSTTTVRARTPPLVKTNIAPVSINVGRQTLYLFPDRLLVFDAGGVGAVAYTSMRCTAGDGRFIEDRVVPRDATVVDHTWQYVNKDGSPDRRFKTNRQLPVCLYSHLQFSAESGLNERIEVSRPGVTKPFVDAIRGLAVLTSQASTRRSDSA